MDMSQVNMNDPRIQALIAQMRAQGGGMPPQGPAAPVQAQLSQGPAMPPPDAGAAPAGPPMGGAPQGMPPPQGGQVDPSLTQGVMGLQGQAGQRDAMKRQYALADALRNDAQAQTKGRVVPSSTGGMMVAPGWANAAVSVGQNLMADKRTRDADKRGAGLDAERQRVQGDYFNALTGQRKKRDPNADLGGWGSLADY
jgi:hypothetical protein